MTSTYLLNTFFMVVILGMVFVRSSSMIRTPVSRLRCQWLIIITALYVALDALFIVCHLTPSLHNTVWKLVSFLFYVAYCALPFAWHQFVRSFVGTLFRPKTQWFEYIPIVVLLALVLATPFSGALYSITADGTYVRGPLYMLYTYLNFFYYVEPAIYAAAVCIRGDRNKEPYLFQSVLISLVPLVATVVNSLVIPVHTIYPFMPFCSVLVALLAYFFMAAKETDRLQEQQQRTVEEALHEAEIAKQDAIEASRVKSNFLSNMSHDIRTPMNAIINLTQLAQKENDINVIREYLDKMAVSGKFLLGLINDILDMSRIENGEIELHKENLTRTEFLNTVDTVVRPLMDAKHINFHGELRPGEYTISVDKLRFNQIFFNLLSNAAKFTPEGGDVWFEVDNLEVEDNNKLKILFIVRDNGIGMSEEFQKHLFEPFAREHSELSSKTPGTGLGLPIVKSLVDAMGGTIKVKSKLGEGSEFAVTFDVDIVAHEELHENPAQAQSNAAANADIKGMNILLVEDNETNAYVAQIILEEAECIVTTAENGQKAVDAFAASEPYTYDAVLMDLRMPIMDGFEATTTIRAMHRPDAAIVPIIAMTADAFDDERRHTLEAGMNYHLSKPVDASEIYRVLGECFGKVRRAKNESNEG